MANDLVKKAAPIRLLILDVDGVLSDNKLYYTDQGTELKAFYTRDGHGMVMLQQTGVEIGIITGRRSPLTEKRMQDLKVKHLYQGVPDKLPTFLKLIAQLGLETEQIAYIGDDILDLPLLSRVGLAVAPADADAEVRTRVDYTSPFPGGQGCVRDICERIMKAQNTWQQQLDFYLR
mgnify:CR=1 FL=1